MVHNWNYYMNKVTQNRTRRNGRFVSPVSAQRSELKHFFFTGNCQLARHDASHKRRRMIMRRELHEFTQTSHAFHVSCRSVCGCLNRRANAGAWWFRCESNGGSRRMHSSLWEIGLFSRDSLMIRNSKDLLCSNGWSHTELFLHCSHFPRLRNKSNTWFREYSKGERNNKDSMYKEKGVRPREDRLLPDRAPNFPEIEHACCWPTNTDRRLRMAMEEYKFRDCGYVHLDSGWKW
jgi:hypothetical protein